MLAKSKQSIHWDTEPSVCLQRVRVGFKKVYVGLGMLLHCTEPWAGFPALSKLGLVVYAYSRGTQEVEAGRSEASGQPGLHEKLVSKTKTKPKQYKKIVYMTLKEVKPFAAESLLWLLYPEDSRVSSQRALFTVLDCSGGCSQWPKFPPGQAVLPVLLSILSGSSPPQLPFEGDFQSSPRLPQGACAPPSQQHPSLSTHPGSLSMLGTVNCSVFHSSL